MNITLLASLETVVTKKIQYLDSDFPLDWWSLYFNNKCCNFSLLRLKLWGKKEKVANIVIGNEDEDNIVRRLNNRTSNKELRKALCVVC